MLAFLLCCLPAAEADAAPERPNILWITSEDNGPQLGCYGDAYADSPRIDELAAKSLRYDLCWSNAPVCAPARTTLITGMYPPSFGGEHMRSLVPLPDDIKLYPEYLRAAGYFCTNPGKTDYNVPGNGIWDSKPQNKSYKGKRVDYMARAEGQPFFHVVNFTISHESKIRNELGHELWHDPAKAPVPAYHPDIPEVRRDWAQYYDRITEMDAQVGEELDKLEKNGLADSTIIFYYGDHGSGMPRSKRQPYNSGLHVPLIVHIPEKFAHLRPDDYRPGGSSDRLTGFVDFGPTVLSLAGADIPQHMQGKAFLGEQASEPKEYLYGFRGRMDERYDLMRSITDGRYVYIRNYMPQRPYGQYLNYMFQTPTTHLWKEMYDNGELNEAQSHFWEAKPLEELYDLQTDPDEVNNLAGSAEHAEKREELLAALLDWQREIHDIGMMPEGFMHALVKQRDLTPYELARTKQSFAPSKVLGAAQIPLLFHSEGRTPPDADKASMYRAAFTSAGPVARYWGAVGLMQEARLGDEPELMEMLVTRLEDPVKYVQMAAAEGVLCYGEKADNAAAIDRATEVLSEIIADPESTGYDLMYAGNILDVATDPQTSTSGVDLADLKAAYVARDLPPRNPANRPGWGEYITRLKERVE